MKQALVYSLKIWLSSWLLGPLAYALYITLLNIRHPARDWFTWSVFLYAMQVAISAGFMLAGYLMFGIGAILLMRTKASGPIRQNAAMLSAGLMPLFYYLLPDNSLGVPFSGVLIALYCLINMGGAYYYEHHFLADKDLVQPAK